MADIGRLLIYNAGQLLTCKGGPKRGKALADVGIIRDGAVYIEDSIIKDVGASSDLSRRFGDTDVEKCGHAAGDRTAEAGLLALEGR
jgi:imidazolonepropionase